MHGHVEVVHLELVSHLTERLQRVLLLGLREAVRLLWLTALLRHAARTAPVALGDGVEWRDEAVRVKSIVAVVAEQHVVFVVAFAAHAAHVRVDLQRDVTHVH